MRNKFNLLFSLLFASLLIVNSGCSRKKEQNKPNILVIMIDTLRADHLGFNGYERDTSPVLDSLARDNLNFKYAYSTSAWTPPAVGSLFSGVYASVHGHMPLKENDSLRAHGVFSTLDESFTTIAEALSHAGYDTACISANPMVSEKYGLHQGFKHFYSPGRESADIVNRRAFKYLNDLREKDKPFFLYLHYMDPHFPYAPAEPYDSMFSGPLAERKYKAREERFIGRYDGEIRFANDRIGEMLQWFKDNNLYQDLIILVVSDHGEQFMERGHLGHADRLHTEEVHVPLILKAEGKKGDVNIPVSLVDVYPTLLQLAGVKSDNKIHGYSLLTQLDKRKEKGVLMEVVRHYNQKAYVNSSGTKLLLDYKMDLGLVHDNIDQPMKETLYDIYQDKYEVSPLKDEELLEKVRAEYIQYYSEILELSRYYNKSEIEMDQETFENLKTLGYL